MMTKDEVFDRVMEILDSVIFTGYFTNEEVKEIEELERSYWAQS